MGGNKKSLDGINSIFHDGIILYNKRDYNGALTYFLSLPDDADFDNVELAYYIGLCYARLARYDDALLYIEQVVTAGNLDDDGEVDKVKNSRVLQCRYILSIIYVMNNRKKLATFELNKLLEAGFKPASVYSSLAFIAWEEGEIEESISYYKKAIEIDPNNSTALNGLGYVLANENRDLSAALSYCKRALSLEPNSPACMDSLGVVYTKLGLMSDALKYLNKAQEMMPHSSEIAEHIKLTQNASK